MSLRLVGVFVWLGLMGEEERWGNEVAGEGSGGTAGHDCTVCEKEECAAGEKIRAHTYSEFGFRFGVYGGMVSSSQGVALICMMSYHAAGAEWERVAGEFVAVEEFIGGRWRTTYVDEGVPRSSYGLV